MVHSYKSKNPKLHLYAINRSVAYRVDISIHHDGLCIRNCRVGFRQPGNTHTHTHKCVRGQIPKLNIVITLLFVHSKLCKFLKSKEKITFSNNKLLLGNRDMLFFYLILIPYKPNGKLSFDF